MILQGAVRDLQATPGTQLCHVVVHPLTVEQSVEMESMAVKDVLRFRENLEKLSKSRFVHSSETQESVFHLQQAELNLETSTWREGTLIEYFVLRDCTRHAAFVSLIAEKKIGAQPIRLIYVPEAMPSRNNSQDVMSSMTYLTANEAQKPMTSSDLLRAVRRFLAARNREHDVTHGPGGAFSTSKDLAKAFRSAILLGPTRYVVDETNDLDVICQLVWYSQDNDSGTAVDEHIALRENLCGEVEAGLRAVHKCKPHCSYFCCVLAVKCVLFRTRVISGGGVFTRQILSVLVALQRRQDAGDLVTPMVSERVQRPHVSAISTLAKILSKLFDSYRDANHWNVEGFDDVAEYLGLNLMLIPASDIVGSVANSVLKQGVFAWTLRMESSIDAVLATCYDGLCLSDNFECLVCPAHVMNEALGARGAKVKVSSRKCDAARQSVVASLHVLSDLVLTAENYDQMKDAVLKKTTGAAEMFRQTRLELVGACGVSFADLSQGDKVLLDNCVKQCEKFDDLHPRPVPLPATPSLYEVCPGQPLRRKREVVHRKVSVKKKKKTSVVPVVSPTVRAEDLGNGSAESDALTDDANLSQEHTTAGRASARAEVKEALLDLAIGLGDRDPVKGADWEIVDGEEPSETNKRNQYAERQKKLPPVISHAKFADVTGNVGPYLFNPNELENVSEQGRRVFLDLMNKSKSTCFWYPPEDPRSNLRFKRSGFDIAGEVLRNFELLHSGVTVINQALLPRTSDGSVAADRKAYYSDFCSVVDVTGKASEGELMWSSIINAPDNGVCEQGIRFGRLMTDANAINFLGETKNCRSGLNSTYAAYKSKGEGDCLLAAIVSRLFGSAKTGCPDTVGVEMVCWGTKMLASIGPDLVDESIPACKCNVHLGCPAQRVHVDLPLASADSECLPPGCSGCESDIGYFSIVTYLHGATIRIIRDGMHFMNGPEAIFDAAVKHTRFSQLYIPPFSIAVLRSDLPHAGDEYLMSLLRLSIEGEDWAVEALNKITTLMRNQCGCVSRESNDVCACDGTCGPYLAMVQANNDLVRGHCYFQSKSAAVPLTNSVYTRAGDRDFGSAEEGGVMESKLEELKARWA